jgi:hypothetical protein
LGIAGDAVSVRLAHAFHDQIPAQERLDDRRAERDPADPTPKVEAM